MDDYFQYVPTHRDVPVHNYFNIHVANDAGSHAIAWEL